MFRRRQKRWYAISVTVPAETKPTASEVDAEYADYLSRIWKAMVFGALLGVLVIAAVYAGAWSASTSMAPSSSTGDHRATLMIVLAPLPASIVIAGFSLLAAVAIALQLAVRTPSAAESRPATALARRRFLCAVAAVVVPGTFALVVYATIPALADAPGQLDLVRLFSPALCGILVALIAADAGVASDPDFAPAEIGRVWRARVARRRLVALRVIGDAPATARSWTTVWQTIVLLAVPVLIVSVWAVTAPVLLTEQRIALVILSVPLTAVIYAVAAVAYLSAITREWLEVIGIIVGSGILGSLCWLTFVVAIFQSAAESRATGPVMATLAYTVAYVAATACLATWSLASFPGDQPRVLALIVRKTLRKRVKERHKGLPSKEAPAYNRLALVSPWVSPVLPFGMILGVIARQQIMRAKHEKREAVQRGLWAANLAIALTVFFFIALLVGSLIVATVDTPELDRFIWGEPGEI